MNQRKHNIPSRPTPNPRANPAVDLARQQVDKIYGTDVSNQPITSTPQQAATSQSVGAENNDSRTLTHKKSVINPYQQTYAAEKPSEQTTQQHDWQSYHKAWQEYYQRYYHHYYSQEMQKRLQQHAPTSSQSAATVGKAPEADKPQSKQLQQVEKLKEQLNNTVGKRAKKLSKSPHFKPILVALVVGLLFLGLQFNRTIIAQIQYYVSPGTVTNEGSSIIVDPTAVADVGPDPRLIIPKINVDVPVVFGETSYEEDRVQAALENGVVNYGRSAMPGQIGNQVILGHSSNDLIDQGDYKFAFILLDRLEDGDTIIQNYEGKRYIYKVFNKQVIEPTDFSLVNIDTDKPVLTLITCTPPGTTLRRLVVQAEQVSPAPDANTEVAQRPTEPPSSLPATLPANSPTILERIGNLF